MPDENLRKLPPTIVWTSEMDMLRRDSVKFIERMEQAGGPLLDYYSMAGAEHGYENGGGADNPQRIIYHKTALLAWNTYVMGAENAV